MFGLLAICFIFALRQGRTTRKKFRNGVYSGFILRMVLSIYMVNQQQQQQLAHYNNNLNQFTHNFNQTNSRNPIHHDLDNEKFLGLPKEENLANQPGTTPQTSEKPILTPETKK